MTGILPWLFFLVVLLHNLEESFWLPAWSLTQGRFRFRIESRSFGFAAAVLTAAALACVIWAVGSEAKSIGWHVLTAYALAMALNALVPHLALTLVDRRYMPGTGTGVLLVLPVCIALIATAWRRQLVDGETFAAVAPVAIVALALSVPLLQLIGRRLFAT